MIKSHQHSSSPALNATETLDETSVAGYMNADFITVPATMTVNHAREYLLSQLKTDEIPSRVFITADDYHLRGTLSVKKLLQCEEQDKAVGVMMDYSYFQVSPDDDRNDVAHLLGKGGWTWCRWWPITRWSAYWASVRSPGWSRMKTPKTRSVRGEPAAGQALSGDQPVGAVAQTLGVAADVVRR